MPDIFEKRKPPQYWKFNNLYDGINFLYIFVHLFTITRGSYFAQHCLDLEKQYTSASTAEVN